MLHSRTVIIHLLRNNNICDHRGQPAIAKVKKRDMHNTNVQTGIKTTIKKLFGVGMAVPKIVRKPCVGGWLQM